MSITQFTPETKSSFRFYSGSEAIKRGEPFAYAADEFNVVEKLSVANAHRFAGIASRSSAAKTAGSNVLLEHPGAKGVKALVLQNFSAGDVVGALVSANAGNGYFAFKGEDGQGSVRIKSDVTGIKLSGMDGDSFALGTDGKTITVTSVPDTVVAGDKVFILIGGKGEASTVTPGEYTVDSTTSTTIVLTASCFSGGTGTGCNITGSVYATMPKASVDILEGPQTGCIQLWDNDADITPSGITLLPGAHTLSSDEAVELPVCIEGATKTFKVTADLGGSTYFYKISPPSGKILSAGVTEMTSVSIADADHVLKLACSNLAYGILIAALEESA